MRNSLIHFAARSIVSFGMVALILPNTARAFSCPAEDGAGFPLGVHCDDGSNLFCSYPGGADPNVFYCTYSNTTGALVTDHNKGLCPANAVDSGSEPMCPAATPTATPTTTPTGAIAAPAPTLTPWGMMVAALLLTGVAAFALRYRMRQGINQ